MSSSCSTGSTEAGLERVGCFKYEPVRGAPANDLGLPAVPPEVKESRWDRFMAAQQAISAKRLSSRVGKRIKVIIDEAGPPSPRGVRNGMRRKSTARLCFVSRRPLRVGDMLTVKVERADAYDLHGIAV
jgi:ribosomal protein S12 methylthiotransferase